MVAMEIKSSSRAKTLGERSPKTLSCNVRKRKRGERSSESDQTASKKLELGLITTGYALSQSSVSDHNSRKATQPKQHQEQQREEVSVLGLFKQQQSLLKSGFELDSCINSLEDFGQVFDDCTDFDDLFVGEIEKHYGINRLPWKAFVSLPEGVC